MSGTTLCYVDFDVDGSVAARSLAAAFVHSTNERYGFTSKHIDKLGGAEISRLQSFYDTDFEFQRKGRIDPSPVSASARVVVELYESSCPLTCANFKALCLGNSGKTGESGKVQTYEGSRVHRVQSGFVLQGGDFVFGNGSGGESIYGKKMKDERPGLNMKHDRRGVLSMGNSGKNSATSQFFIKFGAAPQCDGKHVVFGRVLAGFDTLDHIESTCGTHSGEPKAEVVVFRSGVLRDGEPRAGYWLNVPDPESFAGSTPTFYGWPRVLVVAGSEGVLEKFKAATMSTCFCNVDGRVVLLEAVETIDASGVDAVIIAQALGEGRVIVEGCEHVALCKPAGVREVLLGYFSEWNLDLRRRS